MKRQLIIGWAAGICLAFTACGQADKEAASLLQQAQTAYEEGLYSESKLLIDSIKQRYPKAYDTRRAGQQLMRRVELAEQEKSLTYLDSLLQVKQQEADSRTALLTLEKDTAYQQTGHWLHPSQVIEKNLHRSFLRFQCDEQGHLSMTSIYCGARSIHHTAVRVTAPDGSFAETPASDDSYETSNLGEQIEKADYPAEKDGGVIGFLYLNRKARSIRVDYLGERPYSTTLRPSDLQALTTTYEAAQLLSAIAEIRKAADEARLKRDFVRRKMEEKGELE